MTVRGHHIESAYSWADNWWTAWRLSRYYQKLGKLTRVDRLQRGDYIVVWAPLIPGQTYPKRRTKWW